MQKLGGVTQSKKTPIAMKCHYVPAGERPHWFWVTHLRKQKYCCEDHENRQYRLRKRSTWKPHPRTCIDCGQEFMVEKYQGEKKKVRCADCQYKVNLRKMQKVTNRRRDRQREYSKPRGGARKKPVHPKTPKSKRRKCKAVEYGQLEKHARGCNGFCNGQNRYYSSVCWVAIQKRAGRFDGDWVYSPNLQGITESGEGVRYDKL